MRQKAPTSPPLVRGSCWVRPGAVGAASLGHSGQLAQLQALLGAADDVWLGLEGETFCLELLFDFCLGQHRTNSAKNVCLVAIDKKHSPPLIFLRRGKPN